MKFTARVTAATGPLRKGRVEIVSMKGSRRVTIGTGTVADGTLSATADPGPVWGVRIDRQAIVAFPISVAGDVVDLGEIVMVDGGLAWPAFHATDGRVYGIPRAARPGKSPAARLALADDDMTRPVSKMTFAEMFSSTARQMAEATTTSGTNLALGGATVTLKGLASRDADAIALEFPTPEVAAGNPELSVLSFSIQPPAETNGAPPVQPPPSPTVPYLIGYTRDLAVRKAALAGFITEVNSEIVGDAADTGTVVRQIPSRDAPLPAGGLIRLFIGKGKGS